MKHICNAGRRKIVYVMETLAIKGGLERIMVEKMNFLAETGKYDVVLVEVYDYASADCYVLSDSVRRIRLGVSKRRALPLKLWQMAEVHCRMRRTMRREKADVMVSAGLLGVLLFSVQNFGCREIFESHGPRHRLPLKWLVKRMERKVDLVVALTKGDTAEYVRAREVATIPNFIRGYDALPQYDNMKKKNIVALGRLTEEKGHDLLIGACDMAFGTTRDKRLRIYGDGCCRDRLLQMMATARHADRMELMPTEDDVERIYSTAFAVAVTSEYEGFSLVALEAMARGVPVIACDVPYGPREVVGDAGLLVDRTPEAVAEAIARLADDKALYARLAEKGRRRARQFTEERVMKKWLETLDMTEI